MPEVLQRRLRFLSALLVGMTCVIVVQLMQVQLLNHRYYADWANEINTREIVRSAAPRGIIRDRNGYLLAGNEVLYDVGVSPNPRMNIERVATTLGFVLHMPASYLSQTISQTTSGVQTNTYYVLLAEDVSKEIGEQVAAITDTQVIPFVKVDMQWQRSYPEGTLAAHAIGFCNACDEGANAYLPEDQRCTRRCYGVEGYYDVDLKPADTAWKGPVDSFGDAVPWEVTSVALPHAGAELQLTIDRSVQLMVEEELAYSLDTYQAEGGTIIVMDPGNFEILAMASLPNYDPGRYQDFYSEESSPFLDPAVSKVYEPGSVFKILTVAAALDTGLVGPETVYNDQGWIEVGGQAIRNASRQSYGEQTVTDILVKSLNVGSAWLSTHMGAEAFYSYLQDFGIGDVTGVDLAGEVAGQLWLPSDTQYWHESNLGTNSFGQGLSVTPMQMIVAVATIANDGQRMRPHIVRQRSYADGVVSVYQPIVEEQVVLPETAQTLTEMLVRVIEDGVTQAKVDGYRMAGKTGTAQIWVPGGYDKEGTIASFVGYGPVPEPRFVILVKLDRPKTSQWGSQTAALSFQRLASRLCIFFNIPPQQQELTEAVR